MAVRPETNVRLTDILGDVILDRLGNVGNELLADLLNKFHSALGMPFEVEPNSIPNMTVNISGAIYTLPDGRRISSMRNGSIPSIGSVVINFGAGTISDGNKLTFTRPVMVVGNYIKALIQYNYDLNEFDVTFGSQNSSLASCTSPVVNINFEPICLIELHSTIGGTGSFDAISKTNLVLILDSMDYEQEPREEQVNTVSLQDTFNLTSLVIPKQRKRLMVFVNGVYQIYGTHYTIPSDTQILFTQQILSNADVLFRVV